ncbi:uncharacterized protein LOC124492581 isoform X2 [Dermatophagoides farinae]|uniref:Uncharacterized protein n=1 Tax=Dermatophagoides farinae TaxID=6954 RepID=A0A9D4P8R1_DERFA|nr:uncharacterized protein LOC124492581 isoform X2 [Dermatophagoides farinae]KAH7645961.1 hypothetical protein HUG17_1499 [Dermatophagoides farinae]
MFSVITTMFQSLSLTYSLKSSALISSEYPSPLSTLKDSKLRQPTIILLVLLLTIIFNQPTTVHSIGTLLHAGPSCIIKPQSRIVNGVNRFLLVDYTQVKHRGICYSTLLCKQKGGVAIGKCGIGNSCCVFPQTCNSISVRNSTYFTSPEYPSLINGSKEIETNHNHYEHQDVNDDLTTINEQSKNDRCSLTIHRMPGIHPICQIRLDIIEYEIEGHHHDDTNMIRYSDIDHGCRYADKQNENASGSPADGTILDWITMRAMRHDHADIIEPLCPSSKVGQYVIVNVQQHIGPFYLTVHTGSWSGRRRWNILINQIECDRSSYQNENEHRILTNTIDT